MSNDMPQLLPYQPGFIESARDKIASGLLGMGLYEDNPYAAYRAAEGLLSVVDFLPGIGDAKGAVETVDAANKGDYATAGLMGAATAAGVVPVLGDAASAVLMGIARRGGKEDRLLDLGFLSPEYLDNPTQIKRAETSYDKAMSGSKGFADREAIAIANQGETVREVQEFPQTYISPEVLASGDYALTPVRGDRSFIGLIDMVGGVPTGRSVPVQGGAQYPQANPEAWQSNLAVAQSQHDKFKRIAEQTGRQPIGIYNTMGLESVNFSTPPAEVMFLQTKNINIPKKDKTAFDKELKATYKDWPGLDSPDAMDWILGRGDFPNEGKRRTKFTTLMGMAKYRDRGFPSYGQVLEASTLPELRQAELGESGFTMLLPDVSRDVFPSSRHQSYDTVMPGSYFGSLEQPVPFSVMFPDYYQAARQRMTSGSVPRPFTHTEAIDAMNKRKDGFIVPDQQWLDGLMSYIESQR